MRLLLQHRILLGYIILIAVISSMAATMLHERGRVHKIEEEITEIREANQTINAAHRHITILATLGESAITWDEEDFQKYQLRRQKSITALIFPPFTAHTIAGRSYHFPWRKGAFADAQIKTTPRWQHCGSLSSGGRAGGAGLAVAQSAC